MTDLEISIALALAIGYLPEHVRAYDVVQSFPDTRMFLLILAEALADEGL